MAISETNQLKNNNDLTQHFLYSYSSYSKLGPNEKRRCEFNEDLIFDRSRKSIFTQSQEFGYISDTVYTLSVGNQINDGNSYLTLRSYEGNIEFYNYTPLKIIDINWDTIMCDSGIAKQIDGTYLCYNQKFKSNYVEIKYIGSAIPSTCKLTFNEESKTITSFEHEIHSNYKQIRISSANFNSYFNLGKNTLTAEISGTYFAYHNVVKDMQHDSFSRFQLKPQISSDAYSKSFNAYNPIKIIKTKTTGSYWDVDNKPEDYFDITNDGDIRLTDDYYQEFHDDHHVCENEIDEILALAIPKRLEDRNKIYGFVGGTSTEFYKTKNSSLSYCGENYNLYFGTGNNWNGLDLWFQKKKKMKMTI